MEADEAGAARPSGVCMEPLSRTGEVALNRQIADRLREAIARGEPRLPTERQLASGFAVARVTVRAALDRLAADRLILRRRRHGTSVCANAASPPVAISDRSRRGEANI
jgi:DNA-binding GntR family transcriptional regulator